MYTPIVKPQTYDPSCDLCYFELWTQDILFDYGLMLICMINVIKDLLLLFDTVTLDFGTIINGNVITSMFAIFKCCCY